MSRKWRQRRMATMMKTNMSKTHETWIHHSKFKLERSQKSAVFFPSPLCMNVVLVAHILQNEVRSRSIEHWGFIQMIWFSTWHDAKQINCDCVCSKNMEVSYIFLHWTLNILKIKNKRNKRFRYKWRLLCMLKVGKDNYVNNVSLMRNAE